MNPNLSPDDTSHDIEIHDFEISVQLLLKIQIQTEPNPAETPDTSDRVSHRIKDISIIKIEPI